MDLFIPNICVAPSAEVSTNINTNHMNVTETSVPQGHEFQKIYFEELARRCYVEDGSFDSIAKFARIHYEEVYGIGSRRIKRWKIYFSKYNILVNIEDDEGRLQIRAA